VGADVEPDLLTTLELKTDPLSKQQELHRYDADIVWRAIRDPYDFVVFVYVTIQIRLKGCCESTTGEIADATKMSVGKVDEVRDYLLEIELLRGEKIKNPSECGRPRWRLTIGEKAKRAL
jgi:hypothetical protein